MINTSLYISCVIFLIPEAFTCRSHLWLFFIFVSPVVNFFISACYVYVALEVCSVNLRVTGKCRDVYVYTCIFLIRIFLLSRQQSWLTAWHWEGNSRAQNGEKGKQAQHRGTGEHWVMFFLWPSYELKGCLFPIVSVPALCCITV